jgi:hypothetical protein
MNQRATLFLLTALLCAPACGEDGPHLYFVSGPTAVREADGIVRIDGELWSVMQWPEGHSFCVTALWNEPIPGGPELNKDEVCSTDAVPLPSTTGGQSWPYTLRSLRPVAANSGTTIDVTLVSEHFDNRGEPYTVTVESP